MIRCHPHGVGKRTGRALRGMEAAAFSEGRRVTGAGVLQALTLRFSPHVRAGVSSFPVKAPEAPKLPCAQEFGPPGLLIHLPASLRPDRAGWSHGQQETGVG